jgi:hypothetical protein
VLLDIGRESMGERMIDDLLDDAGQALVAESLRK